MADSHRARTANDPKGNRAPMRTAGDHRLNRALTEFERVGTSPDIKTIAAGRWNLWPEQLRRLISAGGGASLEFLGGRTSPGVAALSDE